MFSSNEELKQYFEKLKDKDNAVLIKSQILLDHATVVMEAIDTTVTELDDAEKTHANLKKLGVEHKARGVKESHLDQIKTPFLKSVEETLGDRYSDRMRNIYEVFIDYVIKTMIEGYNS
jgi:hemoglobin-like flavoprotein